MGRHARVLRRCGSHPMGLNGDQEVVLLALQISEHLVVIIGAAALLALPLLGTLLHVGYHQLLFAKLPLPRIRLHLSHLVALEHRRVELRRTRMSDHLRVVHRLLAIYPRKGLLILPRLLLARLDDIIPFRADLLELGAMLLNDLVVLVALLLLLHQIVVVSVLRAKDLLCASMLSQQAIMREEHKR